MYAATKVLREHRHYSAALKILENIQEQISKENTSEEVFKDVAKDIKECKENLHANKKRC